MDPMNDSDWKRFLNEMVASVRFLNKRGREEAIKRGNELPDILRELCKYKAGIYQMQDLPREEFRGAVLRYLLGSYEDSIYHAFFSVEMSLLIKLEERLSDEEKNSLHNEINRTDSKPISFTLGTILNKARDRRIGIIRGKQLNQRIESLIDKRNTYVHANNFLSGLIISMKTNLIPKIEGQIKEISDLENRLYVRSFFPALLRLKPFLAQQLEMIKSMPDFAWCTKDEHRITIQREVEEYMAGLNKLEKEKSKAQGLENVRNLLGLRETIRAMLEESYFKMQSREILKDSFQILKDIEIF